MLTVYYQYKKVISSGKRSYSRIIMPIMSLKTCRRILILLLESSNQDIGQSLPLTPPPGLKGRELLKNFINSISMVGKYKAILCAQHKP